MPRFATGSVGPNSPRNEADRPCGLSRTGGVLKIRPPQSPAVRAAAKTSVFRAA